MNRRLLTLVLLLALLVPSMGALQAIEEPVEGVAGLARYYPQSSVFFGAMRIDEEYFDTLDELVRTVSGTFAELDIPVFSLRQLFALGSGTDADDLLSWLGDAASIGVTGMDASGTIDADGLQIVVELDDRQAAFRYLLNEYEDIAEIIENENSTVIAVPQADILFELYDEVMVIAVEQQTLPGSSNSLLNSNRFRETLADLPEETYNIVVYFDVPTLAATLPPEDGGDLLTQAGTLAIGATILDDTALTIDVAQRLPNLPQGYLTAEPVDQAFLRFIPADATAVIHSTNLSAAIEGLFDLADLDSPQDSRAEVQEVLALLGIDLQQDILDWTVGDYALFLRADTLPIISDLTVNQLVLEERFDFGVVIAATDSAAAQGLAAQLGGLLLQASAENPSQDVKVAADTVAGLDVTAIKITVPIQNPATLENQSLEIELVLGASEEVFFLTTRGAAESIAAGAGTLAETAAYQSAAETFLENPLFVAYTDGEGFFTVAAPIPALVFLGPVIGEVFTEVLETLDGTPVPTPTPQPSPTPDPAVQQQVTDTLLAAYDLVDSSTITAAVNENSSLQIRIVLTLNP